MQLFTVSVSTLATRSVYIGHTVVLAPGKREARTMGRSAVLRTAQLPAGTCTQELVEAVA